MDSLQSRGSSGGIADAARHEHPCAAGGHYTVVYLRQRDAMVDRFHSRLETTGNAAGRGKGFFAPERTSVEEKWTTACAKLDR